MSVEELQAKLAEVEAERDRLVKELSAAKAGPYSSWGLRQRMSLASILSRPDGGAGLVGSTVAVAGWIQTTRMAGKDTFCFVKLYDGSTFEAIQVVVNQNCPGFEHLTEKRAVIASSIFVIGKILDSPGKGQRIEMEALEFRLEGASDALAYPLAKKEHSLDFLRQIGHLRPRSQLITSVSRVRNALAFGTHLFFQNRGFYYVHTPIITASDCEGAGEMFQVTTLLSAAEDVHAKVPSTPQGKIDFSKDFFGRPAFLTVSGQLNAEIYACAMGSVYTFGPTFRAEDSNTSRHLAEFWMIEPEIAFADLRENMETAEAYVRFVLKYALERCPEELKYLEDYEKKTLAARKKEEEGDGKAKKQIKDFKSTPLVERIQAIANSHFARVSYTKAIEILKDVYAKGRQFEVAPEWGIDMGSEHERFLAEEHFKCPTIVHDYPKGFKAFYMRLNEDKETVAAMDVLVPGIGELIGGSQREERLDVLLARIKEAGLEEQAYDWYLDLRRFGSVTHSGFGLGFERLVCYTCGLENIRESIPFPRWPGHADF